MRQKSATQFSGVARVSRSRSFGGAIIAGLDVREIFEGAVLNVNSYA